MEGFYKLMKFWMRKLVPVEILSHRSLGKMAGTVCGGGGGGVVDSWDGG